MSKELELFQELRYEYLITIKDDKLDLIEKALKALEVIKEKNVDIYWLKESECLEHYHSCINTEWQEYLTQEEYNLLKEVLL